MQSKVIQPRAINHVHSLFYMCHNSKCETFDTQELASIMCFHVFSIFELEGKVPVSLYCGNQVKAVTLFFHSRPRRKRLNEQGYNACAQIMIWNVGDVTDVVTPLSKLKTPKLLLVVLNITQWRILEAEHSYGIWSWLCSPHQNLAYSRCPNTQLPLPEWHIGHIARLRWPWEHAMARVERNRG